MTKSWHELMEASDKILLASLDKDCKHEYDIVFDADAIELYRRCKLCTSTQKIDAPKDQETTIFITTKL